MTSSTSGRRTPDGREIIPYGEWPSMLSASAAAGSSPRYGDLQLAHAGNGDLYAWWSAWEGGKAVLRRSRVEDPTHSVETLKIPGSPNSRVNEYGGGDFWVWGDTVYWVEYRDQRVWSITLSTGSTTDDPEPITPEPPQSCGWRYAGGSVHPGTNWIVMERELHVNADGTSLEEPINEIAAVAVGGGPVVSLVRGADFVCSPVVSPDGETLAWLQWNHPDMPWTAAELWLGRIEESETSIAVKSPVRVAGGGQHGLRLGLDRSVSVCLPKWSPKGVLHFCDDSEDRWMLRSLVEPGIPKRSGISEGVGLGEDAEVLHRGEGEVGEPRWVAGGSRYGFFSDGDIIVAESVGGLDSLIVLTPGTDRADQLETHKVGANATWIQALVAEGSVAVAIVGSADRLTSPVLMDGLTTQVYSLVNALPEIGPDSISHPERIQYPTSDGETAHGLFYPPVLDGVTGPAGEQPPLLVRIHGGPTADARAEFSASIQFWTTAGFAVLEVNYRGSSGFGRRYRDLLDGRWGVAEVADCIHGAEFLADSGRVDPARCVIRGGSAGGFTALEAVCAPPTESGFAFAAATSLYGVTDLTALAKDTHKFESRYLDALIGPLPQELDRYRERSPLHHPEAIRAPVLILQGTDDQVVPLSQADVLVEAMKARGIDHEYNVYEGEGHGFRLPGTLADAFRRELSFYGRVIGFNPAAYRNPD